MKILTLDIETAPNLAHVWGLWNQNVSLNQLRESSYILCVAAKWYGQKTVHFFSRWDGQNMLGALGTVLNEADAVVTYNGDQFDLPAINREFAVAGIHPPSQYHSIDLYKTVKRKFKFESNKLDYVCQQLNVGAKMKHEGHDLWVKVMNEDPRARARMERYCKKDVVLTEKLHDKLLPWIISYPNGVLYDGTECPRCTTGSLQRRGYRYTATGAYQRYQCSGCGSWSQNTRRIEGVGIRAGA